jgi:hypothetical protein
MIKAGHIVGDEFGVRERAVKLSRNLDAFAAYIDADKTALGNIFKDQAANGPDAAAYFKHLRITLQSRVPEIPENCAMPDVDPELFLMFLELVVIFGDLFSGNRILVFHDGLLNNSDDGISEGVKLSLNSY